MKTILITGASGFIGRRMTVAAQAAGWRVIGLDRAAQGAEREVPSDKAQVPRAEEGGLRSPETVSRSGAESGVEPPHSISPPETRNAKPGEFLRRAKTSEAGPSTSDDPTRNSETSRSSLASTDVEAGEASRGPVGPRLDWVCADITGSAAINLPPGIDAIIHLAGKAHALAEVAQDEAEYFRINTEGTRRVLEAAQRAGVRAFVLFSTVKAAGEGFALRETSGGCAAGAQAEIVGSPLVGVPSESEAVRTQGPTLQGNPKRETRNPKPSAALQSDQQSLASTDVEAGEASGVPLLRSSLYAAAGTPLDESCASLPDTPYGQSKRAAEALVLNGGYIPHPVVLRPCLVYGPTPKGNLEKMITAVRRGRFPPLPEVGNKRSMVHVDDVIAAALLAADHPAAAGQLYIVADNEPFSTRQLFEWICTAAGRRLPRWTMPLWTLKLLGRVGDLIGKLRGRRFVFDSDALAKLTGNAWYSSAKIQRELGWRPEHTLQETVVEMVRGFARRET